MRYTILALSLLALACSTSEAPPEAAAPAAKTQAPAEAPPAAKRAPPPPEGPPRIALIDAGKPPLEPIRRQVKPGAKEVLEMKIEQSIGMKGGGWDAKYEPLAIVQMIDVHSKAVAESGVAELTLEVREVKVLEKSGAKPSARQLDTTGVTGRFTLDPQGVVSGLTLSPPPDSTTVKPQYLDALRSYLRWLAPPFPEEPIGVGAKWSVTGVANENQTQMQEQVVVELLERTKSKLVLGYEIKSTGTVYHDFARPQSIAIESEAHAKVTLQPNELVPRSSVQQIKTVNTVTQVGVDEAPDGKLVQTMEFTVTSRRQ